MEKDSGSSLFELNLDATNSYSLRSAASWARLLGVIGCLVGSLVIFYFLLLMNNLKNASAYRYKREGYESLGGGPTSFETVKLTYWIFILCGIIFILGGISSLLFGRRINLSLRTNDQNGLDKAFGALRNYFAIRSIAMIILFLLLLLVITTSV